MSKKGSRVVTCVSIRTNTRKRMSVSRIFGVVVWHLMHDVSRDFELGMEWLCGISCMMFLGILN